MRLAGRRRRSGPELTITAAEGNVIDELAGVPALEKLRETIESLPASDLELVQGGLLMGIVVDANKPDYVQGDFLVRGLVGADPATGKVAVAADVHPGQVVRLHARDAASADRDLRDALGIRMEALGGRAPAGALVFACNGRGEAMFEAPHHDVDDGRRGARRRAGGGVLRRRRDRPGGRRALPAQLHRHRRRLRLTPRPRRPGSFAARMDLRGRTVLLTGATGGIGHAIARAAAARGGSLVLTGRRAEVLEPLAAETGGRAVACDLAGATSWRGCSTRPATSTS